MYSAGVSSMNDREQAKEIMRVIENAINNEEWDTIDNILERGFDGYGARYCIGVIRPTARVKKYLKNWESAFQKAIQRVTELGRDYKTLFVGMV